MLSYYFTIVWYVRVRYAFFWVCCPEVEKVRQPGNLVARKFLKNQALAESFWILLPHFVAIEQFGGNGKEMILVFLQNGHIFHNFQQKLSVCLVFHYYFLLVPFKNFLPAVILIPNFLTEFVFGTNFLRVKVLNDSVTEKFLISFSLLFRIIPKVSASSNSN